MSKVKQLNEMELLRKYREIEKLHQLLAKWIESHQSLEHARSGSKTTYEFDRLLDETMRHRDSRIALNEIMLTGTP